ncbi:MAG: hypothetical protein ACLFR1_04140 [Spirochaetia bacterium]
MKKIAILILGAALVATPGFTQEDDENDGFGDIESMFEEEDMIQEEDEQQDSEEGDESSRDSGASYDSFLVTEETEIGGRFSASAEANWAWNEYPETWDDLWPVETRRLSPSLSSDIYIDARPNEDFRVFTKVRASYPFEQDSAVTVREMFSDFDWEDSLFFRVGKHTIKWGVGHFWSPADVLNLTPIDPEDPDAEQEGPFSARLQYPFDIHNLYVYSILNDVTQPEDIALAVKTEFVTGTVETGLGIFYRYDLAPRAMVMVTSPLGDFDIFTEAVVSYGSDRTFIREIDDPPFYETYTREDEVFFSGTVGGSYFGTDPSISVAAQYFFNGEGYADTELYADLADPVTGGAIAAALGYDLSTEEGASQVMSELARLMNNWSMHYIGISLGWSSILDSDFSFNTLVLSSLPDFSGVIMPSVSYSFFEQMRISIGGTFQFGESGDYYTPNGAGMSTSLTVGLSSGSF